MYQADREQLCTYMKQPTWPSWRQRRAIRIWLQRLLLSRKPCLWPSVFSLLGWLGRQRRRELAGAQVMRPGVGGCQDACME